MRRYRVLLPLTVHTEDASYEQGDEFENLFTIDEEEINLRNGLLELLPQRYKVTGESTLEFNGQQYTKGDEFEAALPMGQEELLVEGGHIDLIEEPPKKKASAKKKASK